MLCRIPFDSIVLPCHYTEAMVGVCIDECKTRNDVALELVPETQEAVMKVRKTADSSEDAIEIS